MKKITPKQYAISLYQSIKDAQGDELTQRIRSFLEMVKKRKNLKLLNKIFQSFLKVYQQEKGILKAEIITHQRLSERVRKEIANWLKDYTGRTAILEEKIDPEILGGVIIKFEDTVLDASLNNSLERLRSSLLK